MQGCPAGIFGLRGLELLLCQPGNGADLGAAAEGLIMAGHVCRRSVAQEDLAGKIEAQATVLQAPLHDAALKDGALAAQRLP